jgi:hypothetical protein
VHACSPVAQGRGGRTFTPDFHVWVAKRHIKMVAQNDTNLSLRALRAVRATIRADISICLNGEDRCERGTERCASARQISRGW